MTRLTAKYFSDYEARCRGTTCGCGNKVIIDPVFDKELYDLRVEFGLPMPCNSLCRCVKHNKAEDGKPKSLHISDVPAWPQLKGAAAADISYKDKNGVPNIAYRDALARLAWRRGFRIGYHKSFLHLDSAAHHKILPKTIFKYDVVTDAELAAFIKVVTA